MNLVLFLVTFVLSIVRALCDPCNFTSGEIECSALNRTLVAYGTPVSTPGTNAPYTAPTVAPITAPIPNPVFDCNTALNSTGAAKCCPNNPDYWGPLLNCTRWCNDNPTACAQPGRRLLEVVTAQELLEHHGGSICLDSQYDLYVVHIRNHFSLLGLPCSRNSGDTANNNNCPNVGMHVSLMWADDNARPEKNLVVVHDEMVDTFPEERRRLLGVRKLSEILAAFDQVAVRTEKFDIVANNCARMLRDMVGILGIPLDADIATFIKWRMLQSSVVGYIRQSPSFNTKTTAKILSNLTDEEVVSQVFDMYDTGY